MKHVDIDNYKELYNEIFASVEGGVRRTLVFGVSNGQKPHLTAEYTGKVLYVAADRERADKVTSILNSYGRKARQLLARGDILLHRKSISLADSSDRLSCLIEVQSGKIDALVVTPEALCGFLPQQDRLKKCVITLFAGTEYDMADIVRKLHYLGYRREEKAETKGSYFTRGDVLEIFPVNSDLPVKITFLYDEIESIKSYTPDTVMMVSSHSDITIFPASEILLEAEETKEVIDKIQAERGLQNQVAQVRTEEIISDIALRLSFCPSDNSLVWITPFIREKLSTVFDYTLDWTLVMDEPKQIFELLSGYMAEHYSRVASLSADGEVLYKHKESIVSENELMRRMGERRQIGLSCFTEAISGMPDTFVLSSTSLPLYLKNANMLAKYVEENLAKNYSITLFTGDDKRDALIRQLLGRQAESIKFIAEELIAGFACAAAKSVIIGSGDIGAKSVAAASKTRVSIAPRVGDYVVHSEFGIAKCLGLTHIKNYAGEQDYIALQYAGENKIYLPVHQLDLLQMYSGGESEPKLSNPNKDEFIKEKERAKKSIKKLAIDLVELYAKREKSRGYKYPTDTPLQAEFESNFEFEETRDQLQAIEDIKKDMESGRVMDRLLCGDVGFGKTEVALRAIFKTVINGRQCAFLAPTTILAEQHFLTLSTRFAPFGIKIAGLTRFRTAEETKEILAGLKSGAISIAVGTHRLLSKDVAFYDIGLLVLDEEQRFGVEHKERIKTMRNSINVLSMSATPIPRTLHMALSGIRDISVLDTPPKGRQAVQTIVTEFTPALLKDAVSREVARGGQVFILYNNIDRLDNFASEVMRMFPELNIVCGHGRMGSAMLERNIRQFYNKEAQVLISTTIIENGIDIPDANCLIVVEANRLGLSQMYQLKGRVGRSDRLATAYFTYPEGMMLTGDAEKRLTALVDNSDLGSGYRLAMMDLEIRGAGNVLGSEQHGHIERIGYDMYCSLLKQAVAELSGEEIITHSTTEIAIKAEAYIEEKYCPGERQRIKLYKRIAEIGSEADRNAFIAETEEMFGAVPLKLKNLVNIALLKAVASTLDIKKIEIDMARTIIVWNSDEYPSSPSVKGALRLLPEGCRLLSVDGNVTVFQIKNPIVMHRVGILTTFLQHVKGNF